MGCPKPSRSDLCSIIKQASRWLKHEALDTSHYQVKSDGGFVTEADETIQAEIKDQLRSRWPMYEFIGEEMDFHDQAKVFDRDVPGYWVLDPLDGTTNFTYDIPLYGISLALVVDGKPVVAVVYDPVHKECFSAEAGQGAYLNNKRLIASEIDDLGLCVANVDYKRLTSDMAMHLLKSPPYRSQRNLGTSVLEWCWLACGRIHLYLHGGQKLWDFAAGYLILIEAGGEATSLSGAVFDCSKLRKRAVAAANNPVLLEKWLHWIDEHRNDEQQISYQET